MLMFLFFLIYREEINVSPIATGVYGPLNAVQVALSDDGDLYVLNDEQQLTRYSANGRKLTRFGGQGKGPGEFQMASALYFDRGKLFVWDLMEESISVFDREGLFIKRLKPKHRGIDIVKVSGGWVYGHWKSALDSHPDRKVLVWLADEGLGQARTLAETTGNGYGATFIAEGSKSIYTPVRPMARLGVSVDKKHVYLVDPVLLKLRVFDAVTGAKTAEIRRDTPIYPFNPDWADIRLKEVKAMFPERTYRTNYYENFPVTRSFLVSPDDDLVFRLWTFEPHKTDAVIALRPDGTVSPRDLTWSDWRRWCAVKGGLALLIGADPDTEERFLIWRPIEEMQAWLKAHPLPRE